jgi:hypothetical protein
MTDDTSAVAAAEIGGASSSVVVVIPAVTTKFVFVAAEIGGLAMRLGIYDEEKEAAGER